MKGNGTGSRFLSILPRYLAGEMLRIFVLCIAAFIVLYLIVDFFDRFDNFLKHNASVGEIVRYFTFKIPLVLTQVTPVAVLASLLLGLGGLSRNNEITAMFACGVSRLQVVAPLLLVCAGLSVATFAWNETVVPPFERRARYVQTVEVKKKELSYLLGQVELWSHGENNTFYNVQFFDAEEKRLEGLTRYDIDSSFRLQGVAAIPWAEWRDGHWHHPPGMERRFSRDGELEARRLPAGTLQLRETPEDLSVARRGAEEYSYVDLRKLIDNLADKGLDVTEYLVDLHLKIAIPFIPFVMGLIAIPLGLIQNARTRGLASSIATGLVIGFSYWVILAFAVSLGHSGALPPLIAAWAANAVFAGIGLFRLLGES